MDELMSLLKAKASAFAPVVPFDPGKNKLLLLDFTTGNSELTEEVLNDTRNFVNYISNRLARAGATYGIGGYGELRSVYSKSKVFDASTPGDEPRRLHIGIDIWGRPNTAVMSPLDAIVHSYGYHDQPGDYGATIILSHLLDGVTFYSLYGHLSLNSIKNIQEGQRIEKGDMFAEFGIPAENGQWPPHLHFQIINNLEGWSGDYPGVCKLSEKDKYLSNCPDPDLILQMMKYGGS